MISGVAIALKALNPNIRVIGAEPANASDAFEVSSYEWCSSPHSLWSHSHCVLRS